MRAVIPAKAGIHASDMLPKILKHGNVKVNNSFLKFIAQDGSCGDGFEPNIVVQLVQLPFLRAIIQVQIEKDRGQKF